MAVRLDDVEKASELWFRVRRIDNGYIVYSPRGQHYCSNPDTIAEHVGCLVEEAGLVSKPTTRSGRKQSDKTFL